MPDIVFVTPNAPLPPDRGGRLRAHHHWRALSLLADTYTIVLGDRSDFTGRRALRACGGEFWPRRRFHEQRFQQRLAAGEDPGAIGLWETQGIDAELPDEVWETLETAEALNRHQLNDRRSQKLIARIVALQPKLVVVSDTTIAMLVPALKAEGLQVIVDLHNMDSILYAAIAAATTDARSRRWALAASKAFAASEAAFSASADQLWVCSDDDTERFAELVPADKIAVVPNVYETQARPPVPATRVLAYVGQYNYLPNELAAIELVEVSRQLSKMGIDHRVDLIGRPTDAVRAAAKGVPTVRLVGYVTDLTPVLAAVTLVVLPITVGGGTRFKILEAMATGKPILSTTIGIEGLKAVNGVHAVIEDDLGKFPGHVARLLDDLDERERMANAAHTLVCNAFSPDALVETMRQAIARLPKPLPMAEPRNPSYGTEAICQSAVLNRSSRLLLARFNVRSAVPYTSMQGNAVDADGAVLPNSAVHVSRTKPEGTPVEVVVVLPRAAARQEIWLELLGWGLMVARVRIEGLEEEDFGLIAITPEQKDSNRLTVLGWSESPAAEVVIGTERMRSRRAPRLEPPVFAASTTVKEVADKLPVQLDAGGKAVYMANAWDWASPKATTTWQLHELKDRHRGETAWLIGNGPSVRLEDLAALRGRLSFAFNRFHLAHAQTDFRQTYTVSADRQMIEDFGQQIVDDSGGVVFLSDEVAPSPVGDYVWLRQLSSAPPLFSLDPASQVGAGGSSVFVAMQIAYYMGVRQFYLYGADFSFHYGHEKSGDKFRIATGDGNHFIRNYRAGRPWCPPSFRDICPAFALAAKLIHSEGGFVRNVTRGGLLDIFEREDFDVAINR